jgi:hypothetical protein
MTCYYWDLLPYIKKDPPPKRYDFWSTLDYYRKSIASWREDSKKAQEYFYQLIKPREWCKQQLKRIWNMTYEELNVCRKLRGIQA